MEAKEKTFKSLYLAPAFGGSAAGMLVVTAVYPLDTLKTRLQSAQGFKKAGGFRGVYKGLLTSLTGTAAMTGIFFLTYETIKQITEPRVAPQYLPMVHMFGASFCEVVTCLVRVPTDIAKQRKQTYLGNKSKSAISILVDAYKKEGIRRGLYRGFTTTVLRDLPFSFIELPVWELLKTTVKKHNHGEISSFQSGICGAFAGAFAAVLTTPLDVAKTRIMLAGTDDKMSPDLKKLNAMSVISCIYTERGVKGLFAGVTPRLTIVIFGAFAFFGIYEESKRRFEEFVGER